MRKGQKTTIYALSILIIASLFLCFLQPANITNNAIFPLKFLQKQDTTTTVTPTPEASTSTTTVQTNTVTTTEESSTSSTETINVAIRPTNITQNGIDYASFEELKKVSNELETLFKSRNYWTGIGNFSFMTIAKCPEAIALTTTCLGTNPDAPYGVLLAPLNPQDKYSTKDQIFSTGNTTVNFRLRSDEAIIMFGITPTKSKFFSYVPYLYNRNIFSQTKAVQAFNNIYFTILDALMNGIHQPQTDRFLYWASFGWGKDGSPLNNEIMNTSTPNSGNFNGAFVIIMTADQVLGVKIKEDLQRNILPKYGLQTNIINIVPIPYDKVFMGFRNESDTFQLWTRMAFTENATLRDQYLNNPPIAILRVTPNTEDKINVRNSTKFTHNNMPSKETNISEMPLKDALQLLTEIVGINQTKTTNYINASFGAMSTPEQLSFVFEKCIGIGYSCQGDDQDTIYRGMLKTPDGPLYLKNDSNNYLIVVGVNHVASGKAEYNTLALYNGKYNLGFGSIKDTMFNGSAMRFTNVIKVYNETNASIKNTLLSNLNKFFVYKLARNCNNESYCYTVPIDTYLCQNQTDPTKIYLCNNGTGTPGITLDQNLLIYERAYADPLTHTGPAYNQTLAPQFIVYEKK